MKTNNEKWQGHSKGNSNSGAGRDGRPFEKRDVKSILKGSRGAAKFSSDRPARDDNRTSGTSDYKKRDDSRPAYGDRKPYGSGDSKPAYGDRKPFGSNDSRPSFGEKKSFHSSSDRPAYGDRKPYENREGGRPSFGEKKSFESRGDKPAYGDRKPYENREGGRPSFSGPKKPWENSDSKPAGERKPWESRGDKPAYGDRKPYENREGGRPSFGGAKKPWESRDSKPKPWEDRVDSNGEKAYGRSYNTASDDEPREGKLSFKKLPEGQKSEFVETRYDNKKDGVTFRKPARRADDNYDPNSKYSNKKQLEFKKSIVDPTKPIRLNKFLANAGICSRREADEYIQAGVISVNGEIVTEMGVKVLLTDKVMFHEQPVRSERKVYLLLNKPKDCVTTSEDTHDRLTVLDLVKNACSERIYPVGRLDRNTTGVLLLTNDGDLASKLTHPKYDKKKIYHVTLDKTLEKADFEAILAGVPLDDVTIAADALEFVKEGDLKQVGIEIHSGQNRVVRRIFEKLGYKIIRLDRVFFAGLTKKQLPRGKYRFLSEREVAMLKMGAHE
jgi:23S rRNA pseudouridine2605 synthase